MIVASLMRRDIVTVPPEATVREAARVMRDRGVGAVIVARGDAPLGIVTERDLARRVLAAGLDPDATRAAAVMSTPLATIEPAASVEAAAEKMRRLRVKRLVVVLDGLVRGIVSTTDVAYAAPALHKALVDGWVKARWEG